MKSLLLNVFWPAWEWGPCDLSHLRYICTSHSQNLAVRDSTKMRRLVQSDWYQARWGDRVKLVGDQNAKTKFENSRYGFREAIAFESLTGSRGDRVTIDDPHSVDSAMSDAMRQSTIETFLEAVPTRLTNPKTSAIIVIMQRLHVEDVSGVIIDKQLGYEYLRLPMEFDASWPCETSIGFKDPRTEEGELLFPARFPKEVVERDKLVMGPYAFAGQMQQVPTPRGGGIIKREWWTLYDEEEAASQGVKGGAFPPMSLIVASLDPAYTEKKENDYSALTIWGVWGRRANLSKAVSDIAGQRVEYADGIDSVPAAMLMFAWKKRLPIHGPEVVRRDGEDQLAFMRRKKEARGLVEEVADACKRFKVDVLLIEAKGPGISVGQSLRALHKYDGFSVRLIDPGKADKVARAYAVQSIFSGGQVYAPERPWADMVISEFEAFPRGAHDDLCLVAGTQIEMADGSSKSIEDVCVGDAVATPQGACMVLAAGKTGDRETIRVDFAGGSLEGTGAHPVFVDDDWIRLDSLQIGDYLTVSSAWENQSCHSSRAARSKSKRLFSMGGVIAAIRTLSDRAIETISWPQIVSFIATCGNISTGQSLPAATSTTRTRTRSITTHPIWSASTALLIGESMPTIGQRMGSVLRNWRIWRLFKKKPPNGTHLTRGAHGIESMLRTASTALGSSACSELREQNLAYGAAKNLNTAPPERCSAPLHASPQRADLRPVEAITFTRTTKPVYNLTVSEAHCYFANGALVHNCDSTTQALKFLRDGGMLQRPGEIANETVESLRNYRPNARPIYEV